MSNTITGPDMTATVRTAQTRTTWSRTTVEMVRGLVCSRKIPLRCSLCRLFSLQKLFRTPVLSIVDTTCHNMHFPQFSLISSQSETWIRRFGPDTTCRILQDQPERGPMIRAETSYRYMSKFLTGWRWGRMDRIHLRGKLNGGRVPQLLYNAALTHTKWMGNQSSPTLSSNCENRRACFYQTSPGRHVWGVSTH